MIQRSAYLEAYQERIVENPERNQMIADLVREGRSRGYHVIVLLERLRHLKLVSERLKGIPFRIAAGVAYKGEHQRWDEKKGKLVRIVEGESITSAQRQKMVKKFEDSKVRVILANKVFKKGISINRLDVIINGSASKSKDDALQCFGRGVRLHADKSGLLYFDIADYSKSNPKNWFAKAARSRKRAFVAANIVIKDFEWNDDAAEAYDVAEKLLKKELKK